MPAVDDSLHFDPLLLPKHQPEEAIFWRTQSVEDVELADGLAGVSRLLSTLNGLESVPRIGFRRPVLGLEAQVVGTADFCVVELKAGDTIRMLARPKSSEVGARRLTPACSYWVRSARLDEGWTAREAAAHVVLWLQQQTVVPDLDLRPVYQHGGRS